MDCLSNSTGNNQVIKSRVVLIGNSEDGRRINHTSSRLPKVKGLEIVIKATREFRRGRRKDRTSGFDRFSPRKRQKTC